MEEENKERESRFFEGKREKKMMHFWLVFFLLMLVYKLVISKSEV